MSERTATSPAVKLLSVLLALIFWLFATWERPLQRTISVPVRVVNGAAGMTPSGVPPFVQVVISGPRLIVALLRSDDLVIDLDLSGAGEGVTLFPGVEQRLALPKDLKVVRIYPARMEVRLSKSER